MLLLTASAFPHPLTPAPPPPKKKANVRCWGDGEYGALGSGDEDNAGEGNEIADSVDLGDAAVADIGGGPCAVFEDGSLSCWGKGCYGKNGQGAMDNVGDDEGEMGAALGTVPLGDDILVQAVAAGRDFVCAVLQSGGLKCWGRGEGGQLGNEGVATVGDDPDGGLQHMVTYRPIIIAIFVTLYSAFLKPC